MRLTYDTNKLLSVIFILLQAINQAYAPDKLKAEFALAITTAASGVGLVAHKRNQDGSKPDGSTASDSKTE